MDIGRVVVGGAVRVLWQGGDNLDRYLYDHAYTMNTRCARLSNEKLLCYCRTEGVLYLCGVLVSVEGLGSGSLSNGNACPYRVRLDGYDDLFVCGCNILELL